MAADTPVIPESPGARLRFVREQAGYVTASDAARAIGVPPPTYMSHENSSRGLGRGGARYAAFFRVSLDWLLTGRGSPRGKSGIDEVFDTLPGDAQRQVREYIEFLRARLPRSE